MADIAAQREARRRRILGNSENRLKKIAGIFKKDSVEEKTSDNSIYTEAPSNNGSLNAIKNNITEETTKLLEEKDIDFSEIDKISESHEFSTYNSNLQYKQPNSHFIFDHTNKQNILKKDNLNSKPTVSTQEQLLCNQSQNSVLFNLFSNSLSCICLAALVNILLLSNVNLLLYKGILTPYLIIAIPRFYFAITSEEADSSNILMAALILCNIKPEVVYRLKRILIVFNAIYKGFALYLTSFLLFNWIGTMWWDKSNSVQFY